MRVLSLAVLIVALGLLAWLLGATSHELVVGLVSGVIAAAAWAVLEFAHTRGIRQAQLSGLVGEYRVRRKGDHGVSDLGTVTLALDGILLRTRSEGKNKLGPWEGKIVMSEIHPASGAGSYHHVRVDGWGFHTVQVRGRDLLVHAEWVRDRAKLANAYVWERVDPAEPGLHNEVTFSGSST